MNTRIFNSSAQSEGKPGYPERSGETVEIVRPLTSDEVDDEVGPMFRVRFQDGVEADVFGDELSDVTKLVGLWVLGCNSQGEFMQWGLDGGTEFPFPPDQESEALAQARYVSESDRLLHVCILNVFDNGQIRQDEFNSEQ